MSTSQVDPMIGRLIDGRYQVRSRIARGGMATVYLATDLRLERRVAIKIMHGHLADDSNFKNRFVQEARSAARLAHPNVVNVFDQGQDQDMAYLVMEYLPGITLRELLKDYQKLTPEQTLDIMDAVLGGLAAAHAAGIIHRDLKPENVLLADDGRIKIGDFGLARAASNNTASGQALLGTIAYLSPELVTRGQADARSDLYALGIMMYEMLVGEQPFQGEQPMQIAYQHANDSVPAPSDKNPSVPVELDELILWSTARDPDERPRDAQAMLDRLREIDHSRAEPLGAPTGMDHTLVMPLTGSLNSGTGETQILQPTKTGSTKKTAVGAVDTLEKAAHTRKRRGWWVFALVIILAGAAGGTGWYFGVGPGANVTIPAVASMPVAKAKMALTELDFDVKVDKVYNLNVGSGVVINSSPKSGSLALKGSRVDLRVSKGPRPIALPKLAGKTQKEAESAITNLNAKVGKTDKQFSSKIKAGIVVSASRAAGDKGDVSDGGPYFEGKTVNLVVSVGEVPDVARMPLEKAQSTLNTKGLKSEQGKQEYSEGVPDGSVINAAPKNDGVVRPGDTIVLNTSKGPQLFSVPGVVGKTRDEAKKALKDAGFMPVYSGFWDALPNGLTKVQSQSPEADSQQRKGTKVTLGITAAG